MRATLRVLADACCVLPRRLAGRLLQQRLCHRLAAAADQAHQQGRYARAARLYNEALELAERYGAEDRWWATTYTGLALAYSRLGKYVEAESLHRRALEIYQKAQPLEQPRVASCLSNLGALLYHQARYADAEAFYQRALTIQESALGPMHPEVGADLSNLAAICSQQRRYVEAEPLLRRALAIQEQVLGLDHPDVAVTLNNLAFLYQGQGRYAEAEALHRRALAVMQSARGPAHPDIALHLNNLACLCAEQGRDEAAGPLYRQALAIRRKALGPAHPDVATSLENYASMLHAALRSDEAERLLSQAKAIRARHAEDLLTRRWSALPLSGDQGADAHPPDWVTWLSAALAGKANGPGGERVAGPPFASAERETSLSAAATAGLGLPQVAEEWIRDHDRGMEEELQRALDRNELQVYYQPIVSLASGQITGAEALLRWQHPRRGLLSPRDFIPLAEETGLILAMGERLLRDACTQCAAWGAAGYPDIRVSVNVSQREFQDHCLPTLIRDVLQATQTMPAALQLDVPERAALQDLPSSIEALLALTATGVRIALDEAGADPSLLLHLQQLPIHAIKLDGALVRCMDTDPHAAGMIASITAQAHSQGLKVIALGVETEAQLARVRAQQCDEVQGYLFRRAAPAELFTRLLQQGQSLSLEPTPDDRVPADGAPLAAWLLEG